MPDLDEQPDISACDREPIHIPGAIQSHGILLVLDGDLRVRRAAGDVQALPACNEHLIGMPLNDLLNIDGFDLSNRGPQAEFVGTVTTPAATLDLFAHHWSDEIIVEMEPAPAHRRSSADVLAALLAAVSTIAAAEDVAAAAGAAADGVRALPATIE